VPDILAPAERARVESVRPQPEPNRIRGAWIAKSKRLRSRAATGFATYYARMFDGRVTASGERFDTDAMVAAHPRYPFGTLVRVTNLRNGNSARVRIVDRGPAPGPRRRGVIIDLSRAAARSLGMMRAGRVPVRINVLSSG